MKHIWFRTGLTAILTVGLGAVALAQYTTRVFQVDQGGRVPFRADETASRQNEWTEFTFTVAGFNSGLVIHDVNINIDMVHSWVEDLTILLSAPSGDIIRLFEQFPGTGSRFDNFDNTYFTDEARTAISDGSAPYNDKYRPSEPLSTFRGLSPNGTWKLYVYDHNYDDYGYLYRNGDSRFEENVTGAPRWRGALREQNRTSEWNNPFNGGTWLEITVPEPASLMALAPALGWLLLRRRRR